MNARTGIARDFDYYLEHQDELVQQYDGKVIVIKDGEILGAYDSLTEAVIETEKHHEMGTVVFFCKLIDLLYCRYYCPTSCNILHLGQSQPIISCQFILDGREASLILCATQCNDDIRHCGHQRCLSVA